MNNCYLIWLIFNWNVAQVHKSPPKIKKFNDCFKGKCSSIYKFLVVFCREQVRVNGFGLFLLIVYPGAYVDLSSEHLQIISPLRQLRVYCAGVWHNFIIVIIALLILLSLPWSLMPFYTMGNGVVITQVTQVSCIFSCMADIVHVGIDE